MYIIPLIFYLGLSNLLHTVTKLNRGDSIALAFLFGMPVMYIGQFIFHTFTVPFVFLVICALVGIAFFLRNLIREIALQHSMSRVFTTIKDDLTPGVLAFLLIALILFLLDFQRKFFDFDEYWHWGLMIKESLRLDHFYCVPEANLIIHKDYPPFPALQEVIICRLMGKYDPSYALFGLHLMMLSSLLPPFFERTKKRKLSYILEIIILFMALMVFCDHTYSAMTLLADIPVGLMFAACLDQILHPEDLTNPWKNSMLLLSCTALVMLKQVGMAFLLVIAFSWLLIQLCRKEWKSIFTWVEVLLILLIPALFLSTWKQLVKVLHVTDIRSVGDAVGQFDLANVSISDYLDILLKQTGTEAQNYVSRASWKSFFIWPVTLRYTGVSLFFMMLIMLALLVFLTSKKVKILPAKVSITLAGAVITGCVGYELMLSILYTFCFTDGEMWSLAGYPRYCDSLLIGLVMSIFLTITEYASERISKVRNDSKLTQKEKNKKIPLPIQRSVIILSLFILASGALAVNAKTCMSSRKTYFKYQSIADVIDAHTRPDSNVSMIYDNAGTWYGWLQGYLQYFENDRKLLIGIDMYTANSSDEAAKQEIFAQLRESDYLFILNINDNIRNIFRDVTKDDIGESTVYTVKKDGDKVRLEKS